jgi:hypothetical protein
MSESLSAIGMIVKKNEAYYLIPLTLPNMRVDRQDDRYATPVDGADWKEIFPRKANLKAYVGDHRSLQKAEWRTSTHDGKGWRGLVYLKLKRDEGGAPFDRELEHDSALYIDDGCHARNGLVLSQQTVSRDALPVQEIRPDEQGQYTKGILRVLGVFGGRAESIPLYRPAGNGQRERHGKKHEIFIPLVSGVPIPVAPAAVETFHRLADERTSEVTRGGENRLDEWDLLPYHPAGTLRNTGSTPEWDTHRQCFRLKTGDLVYFRPDATGRIVEEVSLSAIWRKEAPGDSYEYFARVDPELTPFNPARNCLTAAEALFGFVEDKKGTQDNNQALGLASRLRFSHALYSGTKENDSIRDAPNPYVTSPGGWQTLRILGQPKPPSPALYFTSAAPANAGQHIAKSALNLHHHRPQGRKMYLHHPQNQVDAQCWKTAHDRSDVQMKTRVRPVRQGTVYHFHIDFDNLSARELGMLLYALRPTESFRHKIGMGKSLGLGSIRIDPAGLFLVDRATRYSAAGFSNQQRYNQCWQRSDLFDGPALTRYERERETANATTTDPEEFRRSFVPDRLAAHALGLLGNRNISRPVHTPLIAGQDRERETYQWFVRNDEAGHQQLRPIQISMGELPTLTD